MDEKEKIEENNFDPMVLSKLLIEIKHLNELLEDYRIMISPLLGYCIVDKNK